MYISMPRYDIFNLDYTVYENETKEEADVLVPYKFVKTRNKQNSPERLSAKLTIKSIK